MYTAPLTEREGLVLADWVVREGRMERRPLPRLNLIGSTPREARRCLRAFGYYVGLRRMLQLAGRA